MLTGDENPEKESTEKSVEQSESEVKTEKPVEEKQETVKESVSKTNEIKSNETIKKDVEPSVAEPSVEEITDKEPEKPKEQAEEKPEKQEPVEEKIETDTKITKETAETEKSNEEESEKVSVREEEPEKPKTERSGIMTLLEGREKDTITRGTCSGACPSGRRTPYKIRQVVRKAVMGLKEEVISDDTIWMCTTCYECQERCPRGIKIVDVVKAIRNQAAHAGYMAPAHKATGSFVIKTGHGVPINDATKALRKSVGLNELPPTTHEFPEALEEVQKITKLTGFDSLIGYNWETGELE
mgnify:CR=1 FL=1